MSPIPSVAAVLVLGVLWARCDQPAPLYGIAAVLMLIAILPRSGWPRGGMLLVAAFVVGAARSAELPKVVPRPRATVVAELLRGRVVEGCVPSSSEARCIVLREDGSRVLLRVPTEQCPASPGDLVTAVASVRTVAPDVNGIRWGPGAALVRRGVVATAQAAGCQRLGSTPGWIDRARRAGLWLREILGRGLARAFEASALIQARALLFGDEAAIDPDDSEAFRSSGLAHLLAVSGAHVALLAALLGGLTRALVRRVPALAVRGLVSPLGALVPWPGLCAFVLATGESPSAVRALVGATLAAPAVAVGRSLHAESTVGLSAIVTVCAAPVLVLDAGWQLSIVAAWALSAMPRAPEDAPRPRHSPASLWRSVVGTWRQAFASSAFVAVAAAAVLAWHFQRIPATAIAANVLAAPLAEVIALPSVLGVGLLGVCVPILGKGVASVVAPLLDALFELPHAALRLPFAALTVLSPTPAQACILVVGALFAARLRWRARGWITLGVCAAVGVLEVFHLGTTRPRGVLRVTVLDVGQGDAVFIDLPDGSAMLVDAGGADPRAPDPGSGVVVPFLADRRRRRIDVIVASHPHPDHIGGLSAVLRWASVGELWDTRQGERWAGGGAYGRMRSTARERGVVVRGPETLCGPPRPFHGAVLEVLAPCPVVRAGDPANDASFVFRLRYGRASVLFPGDIERVGEGRLVPLLGPVTVLKVPHHGSRTSSSPGFLTALRPRIALVSAGHPSPFDHPHPEVLWRYRARATEIYSTARDGAVAVVLKTDGSVSVVRGSNLDLIP